MNKHLVSVAGIVFVLMAGGCGDSGPTSSPVNSAEGLWFGSTNTNRTLTAAVLEDGAYYFFYSAVANPNQIAGVIQGTGTSNNGIFASTNTKDFGIGVSSLDATLSANYGARQFLNGSIAYASGGTVTFTSSYNQAYDTTPTVTSLAGVYQGQAGSSGGSQLSTVTVATDGTFTGTEQNGCTFTGTVTPPTRGNVFAQNITFGGVSCFFSGSTLQGVVYFDIPTRRLYAAAPVVTRTDAAIFFGTKIL